MPLLLSIGKGKNTARLRRERAPVRYPVLCAMARFVGTRVDIPGAVSNELTHTQLS